MTRYLSLAETAPLTVSTIKAIRNRIARGQLPYRKLGRRVLVPEQDLKIFLEALPEVTAKEAVEAVEETL